MTFHKDLTGTDIHEPKGITAAAADTVYVADGLGGGTWQGIGGSNVVVVNELADLPAASGGFIDLADDTNYVFRGNVNTGTDTIRVGHQSVVTAENFEYPTITYTGTGDMFFGENSSFQIRDCKLDCPNGQVFHMTETGAGGATIFQCDSVRTLNCTKYATFEKLFVQLIVNSSCFNCADGITLIGAVSQILSFRQLALQGTSATFVGIDLTGSTQVLIELVTNVFGGGVGSIGIKGDTGSANVASGFIASVDRCLFAGVTTPLSGVSVDDFRWNFTSNGVVADTMPDALLTLTSNATPTVLSVGVPTLVLGTWIDKRTSHFTNTAAGRATYNGERALTSPMMVSMTLDPVSGTNKSIRACIALNGTPIADSSMAINVSSGDPKQLTIPWQETLNENDYIEVFIENESDSVDVTVIDATFRVR